MLFRILLIAVLYTSTTSDAYAYLGPGLGAGAVTAILGVLGAVFLGMFAVIYYPIKRMIKKRKQNTKADDEDSDQTE